MQILSGAVSQAIYERLSGLDKATRDQLSQLCAFEFVGDLSDESAEDQLCAILDNILSRGLPTLCSPYVERILAERLMLTEEETHAGRVLFDGRGDCLDDVWEQLESALWVVDPRLGPDYAVTTGLGSAAEEQFLLETLPRVAGEWCHQLVDHQMELAQIIGREFKDQRCDFAVRLSDNKRLIIEIDGPEHDQPEQQHLDAKRDAALEAAGWVTLRLPVRDLAAPSKKQAAKLREFFSGCRASNALALNHHNPFWLDDERRRASLLLLVPLAVARIQKVLVRLVNSGILRLDAPSWTLLVREGDVPCAWLALEDFSQLLGNLLALMDRPPHPPIKLLVEACPEFGESELSTPSEDAALTVLPGGGDSSVRPDIVLDVSMLLRKRPVTNTAVHQAPSDDRPPRFSVWSVYRAQAKHRVACAKSVPYVVHPESENPALNYFLNYVFRKAAFRDGQMRMLSRSLARKDVVGLLPTGAGKSLCYQLAGFLQPGVTLIIDPIRSLMHDQVRSLRVIGVHRAVYVDSTLSDDERRRRQDDIRQGAWQFVFVAPERLFIRVFRECLETGASADPPLWFSYCVFDEAHCVSEWGHDFRPAYLAVGESARRFCGTEDGRLPFIALTGTASYDVLADVQRELGIEDEESIVSLTSFDRPELHFEVYAVDDPDGPRPVNPFKNKELAGILKQGFLVELLKDTLPKHELWADGSPESFYELNGRSTNSGIVFCPHASLKGVFGVHDVAGKIARELPQLRNSVGRFASSTMETDALVETQNRFMSDALAVLVATKAFGMGVDKPNIRFTVHLSMPASVEAFYQEAGRAGRDGSPALCVLLLSEIYDDKDLMLYFHEQSFPGADSDKRVLHRHLKGKRGLEWKLSRLTTKGATCHPITYSDDKDKNEIGKAVYRLLCVGAVDDYTIDYNRNLYELHLTHHDDQHYIERTARHLSKYVSKCEAALLPEKIKEHKGVTTLQKCLGYLVDFVYERIGPRRVEAIHIMDQAARLGAHGNGNPGRDREACAQAFREYVLSYFDSRY